MLNDIAQVDALCVRACACVRACMRACVRVSTYVRGCVRVRALVRLCVRVRMHGCAHRQRPIAVRLQAPAAHACICAWCIMWGDLCRMVPWRHAVRCNCNAAPLRCLSAASVARTHASTRCCFGAAAGDARVVGGRAAVHRPAAHARQVQDRPAAVTAAAPLPNQAHPPMRRLCASMRASLAIPPARRGRSRGRASASRSVARWDVARGRHERRSLGHAAVCCPRDPTRRKNKQKACSERARAGGRKRGTRVLTAGGPAGGQKPWDGDIPPSRAPCHGTATQVRPRDFVRAARGVCVPQWAREARVHPVLDGPPQVYRPVPIVRRRQYPLGTPTTLAAWSREYGTVRPAHAACRRSESALGRHSVQKWLRIPRVGGRAALQHNMLY